MDILGYVRRSHRTDGSTSIERQREQIDLTCRARGDRLVAIAEDDDVSGGMSPFDRPGIGPWLTDNPPKPYGAVMVPKLDRLTRNLRHFDDWREWADQHGKTLISVSESLDLSTSIGRMFANLLAMFAQFERERMGERRRERAAADKAAGRYYGGTVPYGKKLELVDGYLDLVPDETESAVLVRMAEAILSGRNAEQVAADLNAEGIPTRKTRNGGRWRGTTILQILRKPGSLPDNGLWERLQPVIAERPVTNRNDTAELVGVVYCARCGERMWSQSITRPAKNMIYRYYRCSQAGKCGVMVRMADTDQAVSAAIVDEYGWKDHTEKRLVASGNGKRVAELKRKLAALDQDADDYDARHAELRAKLIEARQHSTADEWEDVPTGQTVAAWWAASGAAVRRQWLITHGIRAFVRPQKGDVPAVTLDGGGYFTEAASL